VVVMAAAAEGWNNPELGALYKSALVNPRFGASFG
jgi:hypothetical protein